MSLIEKLPKLAELAKQQASAKYETRAPEFQYECEMLNAAPAMCEVLAKFQPGDRSRLQFLVSKMIDTADPRFCMNDFEMLDRLADACQLMEAP